MFLFNEWFLWCARRCKPPVHVYTRTRMRSAILCARMLASPKRRAPKPYNVTVTKYSNGDVMVSFFSNKYCTTTLCDSEIELPELCNSFLGQDLFSATSASEE